MNAPLIEVRDLRKTYRQGFWMRKVEAVRGISFEVAAGDVFGFLGPNGAGKTTTIKVLAGLIAPTSGEARLFGSSVDRAGARRRLGFLPENPYVYPYLTPREFVVLCGRLSGLGHGPARDRAATVLKQVGIAHAADRPTRLLSKGMLQRTGLAAALVADPELLILDEPMSGLDPVGRKEVRDLILGERDQGRTIFFSTHILTDVEALCDRVAILRRGRVVVSGMLSELLRREAKRTEIVILDPEGKMSDFCLREQLPARRARGRVSIDVEGEHNVQNVVHCAVQLGLAIAEVTPRHETLEALFVREAIEQRNSDPPSASAQ